MTSFAIMAHPSRAELVGDLARRVPGPVVWDEVGREWHTARRALLSYDEAEPWHTVVQDDAVVGPSFAPDVAHVLDHLEPEQPVGLYFGRVRPRARLVRRVAERAAATGATWAEMRGPLWGVAVSIPTAHIPSLVAWCDLDSHSLYDVKLTRFYHHAGTWCRYPLPSLADHDPSAPSLIGSHPGDRRAHDYIGARDVADFDWTREPIRVDLRGRLTVPSAA